jgi:ABC-2 type transport system permease protein
MLKNIFRKTIYERRLTALAWAAGLFAMTLLTMSFYPYLKNSGFDTVVANAPKELQAALGTAANYKTVPGYVDQQIFALRLPLMTIIMSITMFAGIGVGDEDRGTLETLLSLPVSRLKVFWQKFAGTAVLTGLASIGIMLGVLVSFPIIHGSMGLYNLLTATVACWLIGLVFGTITYALGASTGKRGLTIGLTSGLAFGAFMISSLAPAVDKLSTVQKFTPFYYYNVPSIALNGIKFTNMLVLLAGMAVLLLISAAIFKNRDLIRD